MNETECPRVYLDPDGDALLAAVPAPRRALFLDRDGVINADHGYVHDVSRTDFVPGIFALCNRARITGRVIVVVTNQAGIGRGLYSEDAFVDYTRWMHAEFTHHGTPLLATWYCPHHPTEAKPAFRTDCGCRKPRAGMLRAAIAVHAIEPVLSTMVGDSPKDIQAADAAGIGRAFLLGGAARREAGTRRLVATLDQIGFGEQP